MLRQIPCCAFIVFFTFSGTAPAKYLSQPSREASTVNADDDISTRDDRNKIYDIATVLKMSLSDHPLLSASQAFVASLEASGRVAKAGYFPKLNLSTGKVLEGRDNDNLFSMTLEQPIYTFGKISGRVSIAKLNEINAKLDLYNDITDLAYHVAKAYISIQQYQMLTHIAEKQRRGFEKIRVFAREKVAAGASAESDLTQTESRIASAAASFYSYRAELEKWDEELSGLTVHRASMKNVMPGMTHFFNGSCKDMTLDEPISVKKAKVEVLLKEKALQLAKSNLYPTVSMRATYERGSGRRQYHQNKDDRSVSLNLSMPIGVGDFYEIEKSYHELQNKKYHLTDVSLKEKTNLIAAKQQLPSYHGLLEAARKRALAATRTRDIYQEQYTRLGSRTLLDFLNAEGEIHQSDIDIAMTLSRIQLLNLDCQYYNSRLVPSG